MGGQLVVHNGYGVWNDGNEVTDVSVFFRDSVDGGELFFHRFRIGLGWNQHKIVVLSNVNAIAFLFSEQIALREEGDCRPRVSEGKLIREVFFDIFFPHFRQQYFLQ